MIKNQPDLRLAALIRFAIAITALNIAGHLFLGFEQPWAHPVSALLTAYILELSFEKLNSSINNYKPRFTGGWRQFVQFLLPAHISGMAVSMLLFTNKNIPGMIFATAVAILSKHILKVKIAGQYRHFLNPSNTGIALTLLLFPWIGIAPPYQFTENISGMADWILPCIFIAVGSFLNTKFTRRITLIIAWFAGFVLQAVLRSVIFQTPLLAALNPITGVAFLLFSFYMISDPATTPARKINQIFFGASVGIVYGILVSLNIVFGFFFSLLIVCVARGCYLFVIDRLKMKGHAVKKSPARFTEVPAFNQVAVAGSENLISETRSTT